MYIKKRKKKKSYIFDELKVQKNTSMFVFYFTDYVPNIIAVSGLYECHFEAVS